MAAKGKSKIRFWNDSFVQYVFTKVIGCNKLANAQCTLCNTVWASNFTPQVKQARNQSQIFNRKSISRNTTHRQSLHLFQTVLGNDSLKPSKLKWHKELKYSENTDSTFKAKIARYVM